MNQICERNFPLNWCRNLERVHWISQQFIIKKIFKKMTEIKIIMPLRIYDEGHLYFFHDFMKILNKSKDPAWQKSLFYFIWNISDCLGIRLDFKNIFNKKVVKTNLKKVQIAMFQFQVDVDCGSLYLVLVGCLV